MFYALLRVAGLFSWLLGGDCLLGDSVKVLNFTHSLNQQSTILKQHRKHCCSQVLLLFAGWPSWDSTGEIRLNVRNQSWDTEGRWGYWCHFDTQGLKEKATIGLHLLNTTWFRVAIHFKTYCIMSLLSKL